MKILIQNDLKQLINNKKSRFYHTIYSYLENKHIFIPNSKDIIFLNECFYDILKNNNLLNYFSNRRKEKSMIKIFNLIDTNSTMFHNYHNIIKQSLFSPKDSKTFLEEYNIPEIWEKNCNQMAKSFGIATGSIENFKLMYQEKLEKDYKNNIDYIARCIDYLKSIKFDVNDKINLLLFYNNNRNAHLQTKITPNHKDMSIEVVENPNTLLDLIGNVVKEKKISDEIIVKIIDIFTENKMLDKILLTYCSSYTLSDFTNIFFNYLAKVNKNQAIILNDFTHKDKKHYFHEWYIKFFLSLSIDQAREIYNHTAYLNIALTDELKSFLLLEGQKNSHYIQGAYLLRIMGKNVQIDFNNKKLNVSNRSFENPYCRPYFYGDSIPKDSIEENLSGIVETKYMKYLDEELSKNKIASLKDKLLFILNYIRTPDFLNELHESYSLFHNNYIKMLFKKGPAHRNSLEKNTLNDFTYHDRVVFFRKLQLSMINFLLDIIKNLDKNEKYNAKIFNENLMKLDIFKTANNIKDAQFFYTFIEVISSFMSETYYIKYFDIDIKKFTYNMFIIKKCNNEHIFSEISNIDYVYFPFDKNKVVAFTKVKKIKLDVNCMIDLSNVPFIANIV